MMILGNSNLITQEIYLQVEFLTTLDKLLETLEPMLLSLEEKIMIEFKIELKCL
jgi:hypothetical protein